METIEAINKVFGMIAGTFTGLLIPLLQIPMAYYLFAKNLRAINPNQNWFITLSMTLTLGSLAAFFSTVSALLCSGFSVLHGIKIGSNGGLKGAILLPYNIFGEMNKSIAEDAPKPSMWRDSPVTYIFATLYQFLSLGCFSFVEVVTSSSRYLEQVMRQHELRQYIQMPLLVQQFRQLNRRISLLIQQLRHTQLEEPVALPIDPMEINARNEALLASFNPPPELENNKADRLSEEEIVQLKTMIPEIKDEQERTKRSQELAAYLEATECPISHTPINHPVTVSENSVLKVYENESLRGWIIQKNNEGVDATSPWSRKNLRDLHIVNGYPQFVIDFISYAREFIKPKPIRIEDEREKKSDIDIMREARFKLLDPKYKAEVPATPTSASKPDADLTPKNKTP